MAFTIFCLKTKKETYIFFFFGFLWLHEARTLHSKLFFCHNDCTGFTHAPALIRYQLTHTGFVLLSTGRGILLYINFTTFKVAGATFLSAIFEDTPQSSIWTTIVNLRRDQPGGFQSKF
jgi:hypothetical protein